MAQPVLDQTYQARVGNRFTFVDAVGDTGSFGVIATGPNQNWNYNNLGFGFPLNGQMQAPFGTGAGFFPTADVMLTFNFLGIDIQFFLENRNGGTGALGQYMAGDLTTYTPAQTVVPGSLGFGQTRSQTILERSVEVGSTDTLYFQMEETVTYAGFGTLQLPRNANYTNVVQVVSTIKNLRGSCRVPNPA